MMKRNPVSKLLVVLCLLAFAVGCAGSRKTAEPVFKEEPAESPEAKTKPDESHIVVLSVPSREGPFQHPFTLNNARLESLLRALYFQKSATLRWKNPERMLTDPEAAGLAQRIEPALASLGRGQLIEFRLAGKDGETKGELFVKNGYLNFRILTIQGYTFLKKGAKATSHQWKLTPQEGQGFFPSNAVVWNSKETTNWIVIKVSDLSSPDSGAQEGGPEEQPLKKRLDVFP
jgi:hypothetical protein